MAHDPGRPVAAEGPPSPLRAPGAPGRPRSGHPPGRLAPERSSGGRFNPVSAWRDSSCQPFFCAAIRVRVSRTFSASTQYAFAFRSGKIWDSLEVFRPDQQQRLPVFPPAVHERVGVPAEPLAVFRGQRGTRSQQAAVDLGDRPHQRTAPRSTPCARATRSPRTCPDEQDVAAASRALSAEAAWIVSAKAFMAQGSATSTRCRSAGRSSRARNGWPSLGMPASHHPVARVNKPGSHRGQHIVWDSAGTGMKGSPLGRCVSWRRSRRSR